MKPQPPDWKELPKPDHKRPRNVVASTGLRDLHGRIMEHLWSVHARRDPGRRGEGVAYSSAELAAWGVLHTWATQTEMTFMNVIEELQGNYEEAAKLWEAYEHRLEEFRSRVKNDITSLEAGARRTTDAVVKMNKAYADVFAQLNGPEMASAIANAERMAQAMRALSELQSHKLMFAVVDSSRPVGGQG